ncbi:hypothetical protein Cgig2_006238 [Carnegiea gigantea]|uniref:Uncharacterized protein n=1 Tax=Carnegiea gigantea TaxID=171969 RepID=A0A9Q1GQD3_9CARY|nr:hypothetical protein Cgig2_006238 [Carnegiea gigantea]
MPNHEALKAIPKTKKPALKSEGKQAIEQKKAQLSAGAALQEEKTSNSGQDVQMSSEEQPLKFERGGSEKRIYQKAFITRRTIRSFSSILAQLNKAQTEAVRSRGFASFLLVDLKKFSKWPVESFDPYSASFMFSDGQRFMAASFDVYMTLGVPIGGNEIMEITRSLTDEEYDENYYCSKFILKYVNDVNQLASLRLLPVCTAEANHQCEAVQVE